MITSKDLGRRSLTFTAEELVDARITFVEGVVYAADLEGAEFVTPVRTFEGRCADCRVLKRKGSGYEYDDRVPHPVPVKREYLGEPQAAIL